DPQGRIVVVSLTGVFRFEGTATHEHHPFKVLGIDLAPHDGSDRFVRMTVSPEQKWQRPFAAAINHTDGTLAIFSHGRLIELVPHATNRYALLGEIDLATDKGAVLAFAGSRLIVATADGRVRAFANQTAGRGASLGEQTLLKPEGKQKLRSMLASPDGRTLAILFDDNKVWLYDLQHGRALAPRITGQGDISAVTFSATSRLFVADGFGRVTSYSTEPFQPSETFAPPAETLEILYRYVVMPLYTVFPKPGELDGVVTYLVVGDPVNLFEQSRMPRDQINLENRRPIDIWQPIWSNFVFLTVILTVTCVYIARRDF
ncbi:MAG TPA: hypothetical protein VHX68_19305, partial [Planctomycetaceae bacterium]|nr:hypothetical protein [Planctomycetaceae bacterium]